MRDVSEQHAAKAALKGLLLSTSFDLRMSAQNVHSASELLACRRSVQSDPEAAFLASAVQSGCNALLFGVTSNVLELNKLERGEYSVSLRPFSICATVRDVLQVCRMSTQASSSAAVLVWEDEAEATQQLPPHVEVRSRVVRAVEKLSLTRAVQGDVVKVMQILFNLVNNAVKFSSGAPVSVHVALTAAREPAGRRLLVVNVTDRGPGLTEEQQERIFRPFSRAVPGVAGGPGGAGIGLHLSRSFARALGGDVSVHSVLDEGATFTLSVPVRVLDAEEAARLSQLSVMENGNSLARAAQPEHERRMSTRIAPPGQAAIQPMAPGLAASVVAGDAGAQEALITHMMGSLLEHAPDGFMCCTSGKPPLITYTSPGLTRMLGWRPEQLRGQSLYSLIHPDDVRSTAAVLKPLLEGCRTSVYLMRRARCAAAEEFRWMHISIVHPVELVDGHIYSVWRDATEFQDSQAALQEFLVTTSHDMRTPAHSILTAAELLAARPSVMSDPEAAFLCYTICDSATLMLQVITNVMSFMRDGDGAMEEEAGLSPKRAVFDAQAMLDATVQACDAGGSHPYAVALEHDPDAPVPPRLEGDTARLKLILANCVQWLLRRGFRLNIRARCIRQAPAADDGSSAATLELDFQQRDLHLSAAECEEIFSPFALSPAESEGDEQSCLGMHAARTFARGMGGDLTARCDQPPEEGTVLRLRVPVHMLPCAEPPQAAPPVVLHKRTARDALGYYPPSPAPGERQRRPRALVVEDHLLNAKLVARLLARHGFEVATAGDGAQGLATLVAALRGGEAAPPLPDVVLADLHMPVLGGAELVRRYRQAEAAATPGGRILIMALSANVSDSHVAECMEAGMDGHISKPLRAELIPVLLQRIRDSGAACGLAAAQPAGPAT